MATNRDFASLLKELEDVVAALESDIPIEKALTLFERGMKLSSECENFLNQAEQRVEILKRSADGGISVEILETAPLDISQA